MAQTYYEILGVPENATDAEIEAAFKSKAREVHPDSVGAVNPYLQRVAAEAFKQLSEAKSVLLDRSKRQKYDASLTYVRWSAHGTAAAAPPKPSPQASPAPSQPPQSPSQPPPTSQPPAQPPQKSSFWGRRTRLGAHPLIVGGSAFLFIIFLAMLFTGGFHSLFLSPNTKPLIATGSQPTVAPAAPVRGPASGSPPKSSQPSLSRRSAPSRPGTLAPREKSANAKTLPQRPDLSGLGAPERQSIESVCAHAKYTDGPAAYNRCLEDQLARLPSAPRRPDLSGLSEPERLSIESACSHAKYMEGPAAYNRCLQDQLGALALAPRRPDLSSLSPDEQKSLESACSRAKYVEGPAAYNACLVHQLERLKDRRP